MFSAIAMTSGWAHRMSRYLRLGATRRSAYSHRDKSLVTISPAKSTRLFPRPCRSREQCSRKDGDAEIKRFECPCHAPKIRAVRDAEVRVEIDAARALEREPFWPATPLASIGGRSCFCL